MIFLGIIARKIGMLDSNTTKRMAHVNIKFFYPTLIFSALVSNFSAGTLLANWMLPAGAMVIMLTGYLIGILASKAVVFGDNEKNAFRFQCAINNYTFLPLPIILMLWGNPGVGKLIFSSLGSEVSVWTFGVLALTGNRITRNVFRNLASVPMLAICFSIIVIIIRDFSGFHNPALTNNAVLTETSQSLMSVIDIFGKASIPVAMFIVGSRMAELTWKHVFAWKQIYLSILRLLVIPAIVLSLFHLIPFEPDVKKVLIVVAIMPAAVASVVMSDVYDADVEFSASGVLATHIFSLLTIPAWMSLIM